MNLLHPAFALSEPWVQLLLDVADTEGLVSYENFSKLALFHPESGYYSRRKNRVGKTAESDFYTSSTHSEVFPTLVADAVSSLLDRSGLSCETFYELGAEPEQDQWADTPLPCATHKILRLGDPFEINESAVLFSNELFDAQPFQRWLATDGEWKPIRLKLEDTSIHETVGNGPLSASENEVMGMLPEAPAFDYHLDLSFSAAKLLKKILSTDWKGLFIAFDYGKTWNQLITETPQGTARAYHQHQQSSVLYSHPGEQDLTTHVCWDHLMKELEIAGFRDIQLSTQSRFLMQHAQKSIQEIVTDSEGLISKTKSQLLELISPGFFGHRFQVLTAIRD